MWRKDFQAHSSQVLALQFEPSAECPKPFGVSPTLAFIVQGGVDDEEMDATPGAPADCNVGVLSLVYLLLDRTRGADLEDFLVEFSKFRGQSPFDNATALAV